ncbi:hypothetical protein [Microtetraspora niveoalba]|uniref:hypothetical protein n=1 Tax=Microtetraspora niveoalba TaxID=46175 RepID=UPI000830CFFA|nr:hypothetical protein [Microtetraspora niveoalba]
MPGLLGDALGLVRKRAGPPVTHTTITGAFRHHIARTETENPCWAARTIARAVRDLGDPRFGRLIGGRTPPTS